MTTHPWLQRITTQLIGLERQRLRLLQQAPAGALKQFLSQPFPSANTLFNELSLLAVDFETTGLDAKHDRLLSVGFVTLHQRQIQLASSYHQVINSQGKLQADNVVIHHITDNIKAQGASLQSVVEALLAALAGKVMLVHFATIEQSFLHQACIELYGMAPVYPIIDTLVVAKRRLDRRDVGYDASALRLAQVAHGSQPDKIKLSDLS